MSSTKREVSPGRRWPVKPLGIGAADAGGDEGDGAVGDVPVEHLAVEVADLVDVLGVELPVDDGSGPVFSHVTHLASASRTLSGAFVRE